MKPSTRQIYTIALDMKVPTQGPIQILEFMGGHLAGYKGYRQVTGKGMSEANILPYLRSIEEGLPVADFLDKKKYTDFSEIGHEYGHEVARAGKGIVYTERPWKDKGNFFITRRDLHVAQRYPEFTFVNADQQMLLLESNKAAQAYLIKEDDTLGKYYAPSFVTSTGYDEDKADRILSYFDHDGYYVIKPVDQSQGNGVRIVAADDLDSTLEKILLTLRRAKKPFSGRDYWKTDTNPVMLVQPYISSRLISRTPYPYDNQLFDATLRIFATMHRARPEDSWTVKVHDGYWKLPHSPVTRGRNSELDIAERISHSPMRKEIAFIPKLTGIFNRGSGQAHVSRNKMLSAPMTEDLRQEIFPQVDAFCSRLAAVINQKTLKQRIDEHLASESLPRLGTGFMMANHREFFVGQENNSLPLDNTLYPESYLKRAWELSERSSTTAVSRYIDRTMSQKLAHYEFNMLSAEMREQITRRRAMRDDVHWSNIIMMLTSLKP